MDGAWWGWWGLKVHQAWAGPKGWDRVRLGWMVPPGSQGPCRRDLTWSQASGTHVPALQQPTAGTVRQDRTPGPRGRLVALVWLQTGEL